MKFTEEELERIKKEKMEEIDRWLDNEFGISYTRYKNIIDELEKWLADNIEYGDDDYYDMKSAGVESALNKLKELKERNKIDE